MWCRLSVNNVFEWARLCVRLLKTIRKIYFCGFSLFFASFGIYAMRFNLSSICLLSGINWHGLRFKFELAFIRLKWWKQCKQCLAWLVISTTQRNSEWGKSKKPYAFPFFISFIGFGIIQYHFCNCDWHKHKITFSTANSFTENTRNENNKVQQQRTNGKKSDCRDRKSNNERQGN